MRPAGIQRTTRFFRCWHAVQVEKLLLKEVFKRNKRNYGAALLLFMHIHTRMMRCAPPAVCYPAGFLSSEVSGSSIVLECFACTKQPRRGGRCFKPNPANS